METMSNGLTRAEYKVLETAYHTDLKMLMMDYNRTETGVYAGLQHAVLRVALYELRHQYMNIFHEHDYVIYRAKMSR